LIIVKMNLPSRTFGAQLCVHWKSAHYTTTPGWVGKE
jgi:hypothetical protein